MPVRWWFLEENQFHGENFKCVSFPNFRRTPALVVQTTKHKHNVLSSIIFFFLIPEKIIKSIYLFFTILIIQKFPYEYTNKHIYSKTIRMATLRVYTVISEVPGRLCARARSCCCCSVHLTRYYGRLLSVGTVRMYVHGGPCPFSSRKAPQQI